MITSLCTVFDEKDIGVNAASPVCKQMPKSLYLFEALSFKIPPNFRTQQL